jgi:nucleoside 2-deoxyribosyltransferase
MSKKALFLAGPLTGLSYGDALDWRTYVESKLPSDVIAFSALRGKEHVAKEAVLKDSYPEHLLSSPQGTITRDRYDVSRCDALFVNFLKAERVSIGTIMEMAWADARRIPIILAMEKGNIHDHAFVRQVAAYITADLDEAIWTAVNVVTMRVV